MTSASDLEPAVRDDLRGSIPGQQSDSTYHVVIEPRAGWRLVDWHELYEYRDLFRFLIWRQIKVQYAQSALGIGWAVIQPLFAMAVFTVVFGRLANVGSDGVPYALFSLAALVPWTYFSNALTEGTNSLISNTGMLGKVYFPRMLLPLSAVCGKLVDFCIALALLGIAMAYYGAVPTGGMVWFPMLVLLMVVSAGGMGMWLTALAVQYRDIKFAMTFVVQILMYCTPVVYPASLIPATWTFAGITFHPRLYYAVNPMVGVIEGFRSALLGTNPMPWDLIGVGVLSAVVIAVSGVLYFRRKERLFADVA